MRLSLAAVRVSAALLPNICWPRPGRSQNAATKALPRRAAETMEKLHRADKVGRVGLVGLGLVGLALGQRLHQAGWTVVGHDHNPQACSRWASRGHAVSATLLDLGRQVNAVVLAVYDTAGVVAVLEGSQGLLAPGQVQRVVDCSTGSPDTLAALARRLAVRGISLIEAPMSGSSSQIAEGKATMLLGGAAQAISEAHDLLAALCPQRIHAGGAGMGARAKLATNLVLGLNRAALAEGMVLAQSMGIAPDRFLAMVLDTPARSDAALVKGTLMVQNDFEPRSRIRQHLKDVLLMLDNAAAAGQALPLSSVHARLLQSAVDAGDGELDNAAIIRQIRRETTR
jgi:3-hydroxyisobutyrate dehydrogenase-like beta-hydroxyacid dehydrogenase